MSGIVSRTSSLNSPRHGLPPATRCYALSGMLQLYGAFQVFRALGERARVNKIPAVSGERLVFFYLSRKKLVSRSQSFSRRWTNN